MRGKLFQGQMKNKEKNKKVHDEDIENNQNGRHVK